MRYKALGAFQRRSETLEALIPQLYVKGLSVRDISDTFRDVLEDEGVSPATASRVAQTIREDFETWRTRFLRKTDSPGSRCAGAGGGFFGVTIAA